jgi:hypothetical protein
MGKQKHAQTQPNPAIRLSGLRQRLAPLFADAAVAGDELGAALSRLTDGLKPASFLPMLVGAFAEAPEERRAQHGAAVGEWLRAKGLLGALRELDARQQLAPAARDDVLAWLAAGGIEAAKHEPIDLAGLFVGAYEIGDIYQASPTLLWYSDPRRRRVVSVAFLIDNEPPWYGALKDVAVNTHRDPTQANDRLMEHWRGIGGVPEPIAAPAAKTRILAALAQNRAQGIRLPADFAAARDVVVPLLLALPDAEDTPQISADAIEAMVAEGRSVEALRLEERTMGFQTRLPDGSVMRLLPGPEDDDL